MQIRNSRRGRRLTVRPRARTTAGPVTHFHPRLEPLEDRRLLTSLGNVPLLFILIENGTGYEQDFHPTHTVDAYRGLMDGSGGIGATVHASEINFSDTPGGTQGRFPADVAFPHGNGDDFAVRARASLYVTPAQEGVWTFGVNSDDGSRLTIGGAAVITDDSIHAAQDRFGSVYLAAGVHALDLVYFERGWSATVELFAAPGAHSSFDPAFSLITSGAGAGLRVIGAFDVRQSFSSGTIANLAAADALLGQPYHNLVDYFKENSNGQLALTPAAAGETGGGDGIADGIVGPYEYATSEFSPEASRRKALQAADANFDFHRYDTNGDHVLSNDELAVVVIGGDYRGNWHRSTVIAADQFVPGTFQRRTAHDATSNRDYDIVEGRLIGQQGLSVHQYQYYAHPGTTWDEWPAADAQAHGAFHGGVTFERAQDGANVRNLDQDISVDGITIPRGFGAVGIGQWVEFITYPHEISHLLHNDAMDLYNYEAFGIPTGMQYYSTMGSATINEPGTFDSDPWTKQRLGWVNPGLITAPGWYSSTSAETSGQVFRIQRNSSEYFLIENRWRGASYDATATARRDIPGLPGPGIADEGLAIWHVDETQLPAFLTANPPSRPFTSPPFIAKEDAGAAGAPEDDLWDGAKNFSAISSPSSRWNDGTASDIVISAISAPGPTVTFHVDFTGVPRDLWEPNDSLEFARWLGAGDKTVEHLTLHRNNDDYFRWVAPASGEATIEVRFQHSQGDVDLFLFNNAFLETGRSTGTTDVERIVQTVTAGQWYYIKVAGFAGALSPVYTLMVDGPEAPGDRLEVNDTFEAATNLGTGNRTELGLSIHVPGDTDFFHWLAPAAGTLQVSLIFQHAAGDLDMRLYDAARAIIGYSDSSDDDEMITVTVVEGQTYYLEVYGYRGAVNPAYDLGINGPAIPLDFFEPNDSMEFAASLGTGGQTAYFMTIHAPGNDDYFRWIAPASGQLAVDLLFVHDTGDLDLELYGGSTWP